MPTAGWNLEECNILCLYQGVASPAGLQWMSGSVTKAVFLEAVEDLPRFIETLPAIG